MTLCVKATLRQRIYHLIKIAMRTIENKKELHQ
jgi:hypothetical protein